MVPKSGMSPKNQQIRGDGKYVPQQRRVKVDPQFAGVGVGQNKKTKRQPSHVNEREQTGTHHRKNCHGFSGAVNTGPPFLSE
jgi:hypothetical protein